MKRALAISSVLLAVVTAGLWLLSYRRELQLIETQHEDLSVRDGRFLYQHDSATRDDPVEDR